MYALCICTQRSSIRYAKACSVHILSAHYRASQAYNVPSDVNTKGNLLIYHLAKAEGRKKLGSSKGSTKRLKATVALVLASLF